MEEILASIRRIISSEDEAPLAAGKTTGSTGKETKPADRVAGEVPAKPEVSPQASRSSEPAARESFPPQSSQEPRAGTLAGLAQQLRGTKGLDSSDNGGPADETISAGPETNGALPSGSSGIASDSTNAAGVTRESETKVHAAIASSSSAQSLAELAKSINEKIGAVSREEPDTPELTRDAGGEMPPEAAAVLEAAPAEANASDETPEFGEPEAVPAFETAEADIKTSWQAETGESGDKAPEAFAVPGEPEKPASSFEGVPTAGTDQPEAFREALISPSAGLAVSASMDRLKQAAADISQAQVETVLRPLLKQWLDDNLPAMVERMVQQEIDRIAAEAAGNRNEENLPQANSA